MKKQRVLLVDDDERLAEVLSYAMEQQGRDVTVRHSVDDALGLMTEVQTFDAIITDLRMPGRDGMELVREVCSQDAHPPIIVLTAHGSVDAAVEAMKAGAADFLSKPVSRDVLKMTLDRVVRSVDLERENLELRQRLEELSRGGGLIAQSRVMRDALDLVDRVAPTDATVLIRGESGTGKELIAKRIHEGSARAERPFVALNCAALPKDLLESELFGHAKGAFTGASASRKGRFVEADGGTLFLDEIGDLDLELQAKLLRVLQDGVVDVVGGGQQKVNVRIVAATHQDLEAMARRGEFREDLYFRIRVVPLELPPLRKRGTDVGLLFAAFVTRAAAVAGREAPAISAELLQELDARAWPGNVRELENVATRMSVTVAPGAALSPELLLPQDGRLDLGATRRHIGSSLISEHEVAIPDGGLHLEEVERALIVAALSKAGGNRSQAARLLGVPRHFLLYRLEKFHIRDDEVDALAGAGTAPIVPVPGT